MKILSTFFFCFSSYFLFSQASVLGGFFIAKQIGGCSSTTVEAICVFYTDGELSQEIIQIKWGDGTPDDEIPLIEANASAEPLNNEIIRYVVRTRHTYSGPGQYALRADVCCLEEKYLNVDGSNLSFSPISILNLTTDIPSGCENHPEVLQPGIDFIFSGQNFIHNPSAFDLDGDSLAYSLIVPRVGNEYRFPDEIEPGIDNILSLNFKTGDLKWSAPQQPGNYLVVMNIEQFRNGSTQGETEFWLTIKVKPNGLSLFPNPSSGNMKIELENGKDAPISFRIFNVLGQMVMEEKGVLDLGSIPLDLTRLSRGEYFIEIRVGEEKWIREFVKAR